MVVIARKQGAQRSKLGVLLRDEVVLLRIVPCLVRNTTSLLPIETSSCTKSAVFVQKTPTLNLALFSQSTPYQQHNNLLYNHLQKYFTQNQTTTFSCEVLNVGVNLHLLK
jgi:hypothetical protein